MSGGAIVAATDIDKGAIADRKRSERRIRERGSHQPEGSQLFVVSGRGAGIGSARGNNARVIHRCPIEERLGHHHGRPAAPTVSHWVEDLRRGSQRGEWRSASEEIEFALVYRAARPRYSGWHWGRRVNAPGVSTNIIHLQRGHLSRAIIAAGNV